jgi:8-oxo-dGTP pyrophosphatase MutT (NUDIX family)
VPGACALIRDTAGRVLLHRRRDDASWDLIGGSMELGETFEQTVRREVREEIGVELGALEILEVYSGPDFFHRYPNGDEVYHVGVAFQTREVRGPLRPDAQEVDELRFFPLDALPSQLKPSARQHLQRAAAVSMAHDG